jgi:hypothetical protein
MNKIKLINIAIFITPIILIYIFFENDMFLARYPFQDLYWNDLQLLGLYNWFISLTYEGDIKKILGSYINYSLGMGHNVLSTKNPNIYLDIGAWLALIMPINIAIEIRFYIFGIIFTYGLYRIIYKNSESYLNAYVYVILSILGLSAAIFRYEVGILNQYILLATPALAYLMGRIIQNEGSVYSNYLLLVVVSLLSLGVSDVHWVIYMSIILFYLCIVNGINKKLLPVYSALMLLILSIWIINFFPLIFHDFYTNETYSSKGSWSLEQWWKVFGEKIFNPSSYFRGDFIGPVNIYLSPYLLFFTIFGFLSKNKYEVNKRSLLALSFTCFVLIISGLVIYSIEFLRELLPSMLRYHMTILPFLFIISAASMRYNYHNFNIIIISVLLTVFVQLIFISDLKYIEAIFLIGISLALFIIISIIKKYTINSAYKFLLIMVVGLVSIVNIQYSKSYIKENSYILDEGHFVDHSVRSLLLNDLPRCVNDVMSKNSIKKSTGVVFASTADNDKDLRAWNDLHMFMIENPYELNTRTFNQWRYSLPVVDLEYAAKNNLTGLFNLSFNIAYLDRIIAFAKDVGASNLISNKNVSNSGLVLLGKCDLQIKTKDRDHKLRNEFYEDIYIYEILNNLVAQNINEVKPHKININCMNSHDQDAQLSFFQKNLRVSMSSHDCVFNNGDPVVEVASFSYYYFFSRLILIFLLLFCFLSSLIFWVNHNRVRIQK